jgi:hypothetical protein
MSINNFLTKENISTIWDVISDEEIFKFLSRDRQTKVAQLFEINLNTFFNTEKTKSANLMDLNKKYILHILKYIKDTFPREPVKIRIHNDKPNQLGNKHLITHEEIQNERVSTFDRDLSTRQQEFDNAIKIKPPPAPEFSDKFEDKPIKDMESIIKEMTEKRNYEVANITKGQNNDSTWLKPQETSIQNEKQIRTTMNNNMNTNVTTNVTTNVNSNSNKLKYIKIDNNEVSLTPSTNKKSVSWDQNLTNEPDLEEITIFNKLKKVEPNNVNNLQDNRIQVLEEEVKLLNHKMDEIIELLRKK